MNRIASLVFAFLTCFCANTDAQLLNYSPEGKATKVSKESIVVTVRKASDEKVRSSAPVLSLPGIVSNLLGVGIDIVKSVLTARQAKYAASYSTTKTENGLLFLRSEGNSNSAALNIASIDIRRITDNVTASEIILSPRLEAQAGLFRLKVDSIQVLYSKAKIRQTGMKGKTLDLSITIKLDAIWKEAATTVSEIGKSDTNAAKHISLKALAYTLKSATLGESTIVIPSIRPGKPAVLEQEYLSGWYQLIPQQAIQFADGNSDWKTGWYTMTVTVKEANPYALNSKDLSDFLNSNSSDILNLLKQFLPAK